MHIATFIFITLKYEHTIVRASMNEPHIVNINLYVCLDIIIISVDFTGYSDSFTVTDLPDLNSVSYC